jgi:hypothetical protein
MGVAEISQLERFRCGQSLRCAAARIRALKHNRTRAAARTCTHGRTQVRTNPHPHAPREHVHAFSRARQHCRRLQDGTFVRNPEMFLSGTRARFYVRACAGCVRECMASSCEMVRPKRSGHGMRSAPGCARPPQSTPSSEHYCGARPHARRRPARPERCGDALNAPDERDQWRGHRQACAGALGTVGSASRWQRAGRACRCGHSRAGRTGSHAQPSWQCGSTALRAAVRAMAMARNAWPPWRQRRAAANCGTSVADYIYREREREREREIDIDIDADIDIDIDVHRYI